jgi:transposase
MEKSYSCIAGVDVSKMTLDVCLITVKNSAIIDQLRVANNRSGYLLILKWLSSHGFKTQDCLFMLEHTGIYSLAVCFFLKQRALSYSLISGLALRKSLGITRGKDDRKDAFSIARFGYLYREELELNQLKNETLLRLQVVFSQRKRLVMTLKSLLVPIKEMKSMGLTALANEAERGQAKTVQSLKVEIKELEKSMKTIVEADVELNTQYSLCTSLPGVGMQLSCYILIVTHGFTRFENSRSLASFSGVAPFPYQSGTSIRGKNRTHPMADKQLKSLLHMSSLNAIRLDNQLRHYYQRKKAEGKHSMLVLNAVSNKMLSRIMATVKRGSPYVQLDQHLN